MFVLSNFMIAIANVLDTAFNIFYWLILIRALISWVNPDPFNPIVQFLYAATEWLLAPLRKLIPTWRIGIDLSPIIAFLLLIFLRSFLVMTLQQLALRLR